MSYVRQFFILILLFFPDRLSAQAVLNPNQITGRIGIINNNSEILSAFNPVNNPYGLENISVMAKSMSAPVLTSWAGAMANGALSLPYTLTADTRDGGIIYGLTFVPYWKDGYRIEDSASPKVLPPLYPEPAPDLTYDHNVCFGLVKVNFLNNLQDPVSIKGGSAYYSEPEDTGTSWKGIAVLKTGITRYNLPVYGNEKTKKLLIQYQIGSSIFTDLMTYSCEKLMVVRCDEVAVLDCTVPEGGALGNIIGRADVLGENEIFEDSEYSPYTGLEAYAGPLNNRRLGKIAVTPSEGNFILPNLVPSDAIVPVKKYAVKTSFKFRRGFAGNILNIPPVSVDVRAGQNDIGNTFVINPSYISGTVRLAGPVKLQGVPYLKYLYRGTDVDKDGEPDQAASYSFIRASGGWASLPGSPSNIGANAQAGFSGELNEDGELSGNYEIVPGSVGDKAAYWDINNFRLYFFGSSDYLQSQMSINDSPTEVLMAPGAHQAFNHHYCLSEINLRFLSLSSLMKYSNFTGTGYFEGTDFEGINRRYEVQITNAQGVPSSGTASNQIISKTMLPQGTYTLNPSAGMLDGSRTEFKPLELKVGCRQIIDASSDIYIGLNPLPAETFRLTENFAGSVKSTLNVSEINYRVNGGEKIIVCQNCGVSPDFAGLLNLSPGDNQLEVTAVDIEGKTASVKASVKRLVTEPLEILNCSDIDIEISHLAPGAAVQFDISSSGGCDDPIHKQCSRESGSLFEAGATEVTCSVTDTCGQSDSCSFNVNVSRLPAPPTPTIAVPTSTPTLPPTQTYTPTAEPTATPVLPTRTATTVPTFTPEPTHTPIPPTQTPTAVPTEPSPSAIPTTEQTPLIQPTIEPTPATEKPVTCPQEDIMPAVSCSVGTPLLWPDNHKFADPGFSYSSRSTCRSMADIVPEIPLTSSVAVWSDETEIPQIGDGSGMTAPDAMEDNTRILLRSERRGTEDGRVYLMIASAIDQTGKKATACCTVVVPHSNRPESHRLVYAQADAARRYCEESGKAPTTFTRHGVSGEISEKDVKKTVSASLKAQAKKKGFSNRAEEKKFKNKIIQKILKKAKA